MVEDEKKPGTPGGDPQSDHPGKDEADDLLLVQRAAKGYRPAFDQLVERYQNQVYRLAWRFFADPDDAMDATQEIFLKAYRSLPSFEGRSSFKTWLYRIAANTCMTLSESRSRRQKTFIQSVIDWFTTPPAPDPSHLVVEQESRAELQEIVQKKIAALPEVYRVPVILRDIEGMSLDQIGQILDIPEGTVKSRINRGRRLLQDSLESFYLGRKEA